MREDPDRGEPAGLDTRRPPTWLARAFRGPHPRRLYAVTTTIALLVAAMTSTIISRWLLLPGLALSLGLLWFIAVATDQRRLPLTVFILATAALVLFALFLVQDEVLEDRGRKVGGVVIATAQEGDRTTCEVRYDDGRVAEGPFGGCRGAATGEHISLYVDPKGEVDPSNTAPDATLWLLSIMATASVSCAAVTWAAVIGVRREHDCLSRELAAAPAPVTPPPPPSPPPGRL
ncbi:hypothetical protein GCM10009837_64160 [Streptomyces durmitorensis]|uniref:Integral membrane protein n=1 Tax=Streptomyces durmitorensis TaxID=319947 RepID=A0ABY4PVP6_9ACTN|nr:hypothetical protein [Streptomyces durmitorensis]UQT57033.1 hypothetical protein M4V62_19060 [Streptomyces durmitorensis]